MTDQVSAEWGEAMEARIKGTQEVIDLDALWRKAIKPKQSPSPFFRFVRWWVHWRMRELMTSRARTMPHASKRLRAFGVRPELKPIEQWPEEWWLPIPETEIAAYKQRQRPRNVSISALSRRMSGDSS